GLIEILCASTGNLVGDLRILCLPLEVHLLWVLLSREVRGQECPRHRSVCATRSGSLGSQRATQALEAFDHPGGPLCYFEFAQRTLTVLEECAEQDRVFARRDIASAED